MVLLLRLFISRTNRSAPNLGTYYFRHEDTTDTEMQPLPEPKPRGEEESSEEEWTYSSTHPEKHPAPEVRKDILRLVQEAEELVRESPVKRTKPSLEVPLNKMSRVKQWLNMDKPEDSCDASCEDEERESTRSSEDLNESVATCRAVKENGTLTESDLTPKVVLRQKRQDLKRNRPWSVSCTLQLPVNEIRYVTRGTTDHFVSLKLLPSLVSLQLVSYLSLYTRLSVFRIPRGNSCHQELSHIEAGLHLVGSICFVCARANDPF